MRTFKCRCGGTFFFGNTSCLACGARTALCWHCNEVKSIEPAGEKSYICDGCGSKSRLCENNSLHNVCNRSVDETSSSKLCRYCALNTVIPDLSFEGNLLKWGRLEAAKQRVLYEIEQIGLPILTDESEGQPVLRFEFKAMSAERVMTGHENGLITINISEADSVERERTRVAFGEPQRTLVGHFRHELGHYYWDVLVRGKFIAPFRKLFGDESNPSYADAQAKYYASVTPVNWQGNFVSQYATMHPWEDFAESFGVYLDMVAIVETAKHFEQIDFNVSRQNFDAMWSSYRDIGIVANEFNRDMGLVDLVPEVFTDAVIEKLRFIHSLCQ